MDLILHIVDLFLHLPNAVYLTTHPRSEALAIFTMTIRASGLFILSARVFVRHLCPMGFKKWRKGEYRLRYLIRFWYIIETKNVVPVKQILELYF